MVVMDFVQVTVVDIVNMIPVLDGCMTTSLCMIVVVIGVSFVFHMILPFSFFFCVVKSIQYKVSDMVVREGVIDVLSLPALCDYPALF
jgi:hypothetical protein